MNGARGLAFVVASFLTGTGLFAAGPSVPGCNGKCATLFSADDGGWKIYASGGTWGSCDEPVYVEEFANVLVGTASADVIVNQYTAAGVRIYGRGGDDTVCGSAVAERIVTLDGDDWISSGAGADYVFAAGGTNTIDVGMESDTDSAFAGSGGDTFVANAPGDPGYAIDIACLGDGANAASSYVSGLRILTGSGPDIVSMSSTSDSPKVFAGTGSDLISIGSTSASSTLVAGSSSATIYGSPSSYDQCEAPLGATLTDCNYTLIAPSSAICVAAAVLDETAPTAFNFNLACDLNRDGDTLDANESRSWDMPTGGGVRIEQLIPTPVGLPAAACTITETSASGNENLTVSCTRTKADGVAPDPTYGTASATISDILRDTIQCQFVRATPTVVESCVGQPFGTACDDGNACTQDDICDEDVCSGESVICAALDQCHVAGTCDPATGSCSNPQADDGTTCDDSNACTRSDECASGTCLGFDGVTCPPAGQCYDDSTCDPATGQCSSSPLPAGTPCIAGRAPEGALRAPVGRCDGPDTCDGAGVCQANIFPDGTGCDDSNACTQTDTCSGGTCVGGSPVVCSALDACHGVGSCIPATGECSNPPVADGTSCDDGDLCTRTDTCTGGACSGGDPVICSALGQCYEAGTCSAATGLCTTPYLPADTPCNAGLAPDGVRRITPVDGCDLADSCDGAGNCSANVQPDGTGCDDANACTQTDTCSGGTCVGGSPVVCSALDACHGVGTCETETGECSNPPVADGTSCEDGDLCTRTDACQSGTCVGSEPVVCAALGSCYEVGTCDSATGECSNPFSTEGTSCDAGAAAPGAQRGAVVDGCDLADSCDGAGTCSANIQPDGTACDDSNACTQGDSCESGACESGTPVVCSDPGECYESGSCDTATGLCSYPFSAAGTACGEPADTPCTDPDSCDGAGVCLPNHAAEETSCGGDDCLDLHCHRGNCSGGPINEDGACDDGNDCTSGTTCDHGLCQGGEVTVCDSPGECEEGPGTCEAGSDGCTYPPKAAGASCGDIDPLGLCDAGDTCDGAGDCQSNVSEAEVVCREAAGECDLEETCDGTSVDCPADEFATADTPCGDRGSGDCTEPDACDAEGVCQPNHLECGLVTGGGTCLVDKSPGRGVCVAGSEDCSPCVVGDAGSACVLGGGVCEETRDFRLVFTPDVKLWPAHKLNATNAGQHRYNLFVDGTAGEEQTVTIEIPFPFVTVGANPVHAYDGMTTGQDGDCFAPVDEIPVSQAWVALADWSDGTQGGPGNLDCDRACGPLTCATAATCTFDVTFTVPESGMTYVQVHLDYGLKGTFVDGNPCDTFADRYDPAAANPAGGRDALENNSSQDGEVRIADGQAYEFAHSVGAEPEGGDTLHSTNEFKRIAGVLGLVSTSADGNGVAGATVELLRTGKLIARATTDVDGFYAISYRHKGKAATYIVRYRGETTITRQIQLKANGWAEVNFDLTTGGSFGQVGSGAVR